MHRMQLFLLRRCDGRSHTEPIKTLAFNVVDVVAQKQHFAAFTSLCTYEFGFLRSSFPRLQNYIHFRDRAAGR